MDNLIASSFQRAKPDCKFESFYTTYSRKKIDFFSVYGLGSHYNILLEAIGVSITFVPVGKQVRFSLKKTSNVKVKRENWTNWDLDKKKKKLKNHFTVGEWLMETLQNSQDCWKTNPRKRKMTIANVQMQLTKYAKKRSETSLATSDGIYEYLKKHSPFCQIYPDH